MGARGKKKPNPQQRQEMRHYRQQARTDDSRYIASANYHVSGSGRKHPRPHMGITKKPSSTRLPASVMVGRIGMAKTRRILLKSVIPGIQ